VRRFVSAADPTDVAFSTEIQALTVARAWFRFSVNPTNDYAAALREYAERYGADTSVGPRDGPRDEVMRAVEQGFRIGVQQPSADRTVNSIRSNWRRESFRARRWPRSSPRFVRKRTTML